MITRSGLMVAVLSMLGAAHAGAATVTFTFTSSLLYAQPGQTVIFSGTATNAGITSAYLNGDSATFPLPVDTSPFFAAPPVLLPGASYTGPILEVAITSATPLGLYVGVFNVLGGDSVTAFDVLASAPFAVQVVPEPSTLISVFGVLATGVILRLRRHHAR